jgi:hypothetical protein
MTWRGNYIIRGGKEDMARKRSTTTVREPVAPVVSSPDLTTIPYIAPSLRALAVPIDSIFTDPDNARTHPEDNMTAIKKSLQRFGQDQPLVVQKQGMIVRKGNGRLEAAKQLGWKFVAVVIVDEDDIDAAARAIADNRSAELAQWDERVLVATMAKWRDMTGQKTTELGFTEDQLSAIAARLGQPVGTETMPPGEFPSFDENIPIEHHCPSCGYKWSGKSNPGSSDDQNGTGGTGGS